ncbi:sec14 cytosolic factor-like isoform X2 [Solanum stenotomum]|uniref:sec14 cytosolic factor-like isoform X2 n=1 Tax=Solanum stenotomum TaxID=172797 RepID=UPI0020D016F0|nr:sec14 cytosolic factor-like isoform X2 [Solanum stenotomum]
MDRNQEIALTQMRKSVEKLGSSTESCGEKTLMRFLIARSMNPEKAAKMFCQWKKWRAEMGLSKNGNPVVMVKSNKHFPSKDQVQFKKFVVHLLDKTIASSFNGRETGNEKLIGIVDLQDITYSNADLRGLITGFQFLQAYYPERLATCYLLNMPQFFVTVWRFVCRFLDKATQEKVRIVTSEEQKQEFIREVGEDVLPEEYGGRAKLVLLQNVVVNY